MGYISAFLTGNPPLSMELDELRLSEEEIRVEYKLILRDGPDGIKLDGSTKEWEEANLKLDRNQSNTYILTLSPRRGIVEGTCMKCKIRIMGQKRIWLRKPPWIVIRDWDYKKPPLKDLKGRIPIQRTQVFIIIE